MMKKIKSFLSPLQKKHPFATFVISISLLLGYVITANAVNLWSDLHKSDTAGTEIFAVLELVILTLGFLLFPFGIVWAKKNKLFSEYWLMIITEVVIIASLTALGVQPHYCDNPYYDQPVLLILENAGSMFLAASVIQGPLLMIAYCFFTDKEKRKATISRRIVLSALALLLSAFLIFCNFWLFHT